ncbi:MAG: RNA polymerase sigma factor [Patescibacteria group bacterium]|jgi:RNA polymerase sigma-70 factor (ECF subfamily)
MSNGNKPIVINAQTNSTDFGKMYQKYGKKVYNYLWYRVGYNTAVAEDLMQETFLRAYEHLPRFKFRGFSYLTYLITIARNLLANHFRRPTVAALEEAGFLAIDMADNVERKLAIDRLWREISRLSITEQRILQLRYREDLSIRQIARHMKRSENAVKLSLSRSRQKVRRRINELEQQANIWAIPALSPAGRAA